MAKAFRRLAITLVAVVLAAAGCLDLDGYHLEDAGADADAGTD